MKDKEIIEEMAKDLKEVETDVGHILVNETFSYVKEHKKYNPKKDFSNTHSKTFEELTAEEMFKKGYRNCKDKVVLSREEYEKLLESNKNLKYSFDTANSYIKKLAESCEKNCKKFNGITIQQSRKETAEKIIDLIKAFCPDKKFVEVITRIISERFGVEIKE